MNINRWIGIGRLTRDPELRHTAGGTPVCNFTLAINNRKKDGDVWVDDPAFIDVEVWKEQGENCAQYLAKGRLAGVDGRIVQQKWEKDGQKRSKLVIVANTVQFLDRAPDDEGSSGGSDYMPPATADDDIQF